MLKIGHSATVTLSDPVEYGGTTREKPMYYAICNLDVFISKDKKRVKKISKRARFDVEEYGWIPVQVFSSPNSFRKEFGHSLIHDLDQGVIFHPEDFSVIRSI